MENNGWRNKYEIASISTLCFISGLLGCSAAYQCVSYKFHGEAIENNFAHWEVINKCTGETTFKWNVQTNNVTKTTMTPDGNLSLLNSSTLSFSSSSVSSETLFSECGVCRICLSVTLSLIHCC